MKSSQITLTIIGFILLALMATNPTIEDHRQAVIEKMKEKMTESSNSDTKNEWQKAGEAIGMAIGGGIVEKAVSRDNYLLFSLTKITFGENTKKIGIGALGNVWLIWYEKYINETKEKKEAERIENDYQNYDGKLPEYSWMNPDQIGLNIERFSDSNNLINMGFSKSSFVDDSLSSHWKIIFNNINFEVAIDKSEKGDHSFHFEFDNLSRINIRDFYLKRGLVKIKSKNKFDWFSDQQKRYLIMIWDDYFQDGKTVAVCFYDYKDKYLQKIVNY